MRKFYLHTIDKTKSFDLNTTAALATNPTGLGNLFSADYKKSEKGKHLTNNKPNFPNIKFTIYFNADNTNPYINYKSLLSFLAECGTSPFLLEYNDGVTDKFCEIIVKDLPKSETNEDGIFAEDFTFERQTYWYETVEENFALKNTDATATSFPLGFPFGFVGKVLQKRYKIKNKFYLSAPITIEITGCLKNEIDITLATLNGDIVQEIKLSTNNEDGTVIIIEPTTKKITVEKDGHTTNGYGLTDKTKQSFLSLPQGEYYIGSNMDDYDTGSIEFKIKRYLFD